MNSVRVTLKWNEIDYPDNTLLIYYMCPVNLITTEQSSYHRYLSRCHESFTVDVDI